DRRFLFSFREGFKREMERGDSSPHSKKSPPAAILPPRRRKKTIHFRTRRMYHLPTSTREHFREDIAMKGLLIMLVALGVAGLWILRPAAAGEGRPDKLWVFVGTYTGPKSKGIYRFEFDLASGKAGTPVVAAETTNPSFLAIHPNRKFLYAVGEITGKKDGAIKAFALDAKTGTLTFLNEQSSGGNGPCHVVVDKTGKCVLAANYGGG